MPGSPIRCASAPTCYDLPCLLVQRASTPFRDRLAGSSAQPPGVSPALVDAFSPRLLWLRGTGVQSRITDLRTKVEVLERSLIDEQYRLCKEINELEGGSRRASGQDGR